jgi:hypothetical protein
MVAD